LTAILNKTPQFFVCFNYIIVIMSIDFVDLKYIGIDTKLSSL
jgi:hypothetical protein